MNRTLEQMIDGLDSLDTPSVVVLHWYLEAVRKALQQQSLRSLRPKATARPLEVAYKAIWGNLFWARTQGGCLMFTPQDIEAVEVTLREWLGALGLLTPAQRNVLLPGIAAKVDAEAGRREQ